MPPRRRTLLSRQRGRFTSIAAATPLVLVLDIDAICTHLNGRFDRELVDTLRVLAATDVRIVLVSTYAHLLAESLRSSLESAWWCDRRHGWDDGRPSIHTDDDAWPNHVVARLRERAPSSSVVAISNDARLQAALRDDDVAIALAPLEDDAARVDMLVRPDQLCEIFWNVIQLRALHPQSSGRHVL